MLAKADIESSRLFLTSRLVDEPAWSDINPSREMLFRLRDTAMNKRAIRRNGKRRRGTNRSALFSWIG
jgi:hypothetical protein